MKGHKIAVRVTVLSGFKTLENREETYEVSKITHHTFSEMRLTVLLDTG